MTRVLLDTDIGGDFDDANALLLLAALDDVELVAVTTVGAGGDARRRARVAAYVLRLAGLPQVPVHAGLDHPAVPNAVLEGLADEHVLNAYVEEMADGRISETHAVEALIAAANADGDSLTLVTIGALTNVAAAIQKDAASMARIGRIIAMAGAFRGQLREANVAIDPEAAAVVFRSGIPVTAVGVEEASRSTLPLAVYDEPPFASSPLGAVYSAMAHRYAAAYRTDRVVLYDVTAATAAVRPQWFVFDEVRAAVELRGDVTRGMTVVERDAFFNSVPGAGPLTVAVDHDANAVGALFRSAVLEGAWPAGEGES